MKVIILAILLIALINAQTYEELEQCLSDRCNDQYTACKAKNNCEDNLKKCAAKCQIKVDTICWGFCLNFESTAVDACTCAVKQECIKKNSFLDNINFSLMKAINMFQQQQLTQEQ